ncbi:MAG: DUF1934 domain-containing protein [Paraclostridium sp.]
MREVSISVKTEQIDKLGNRDSMKVVSKGKIYDKKGDTYIVYKEKLGNEEELVTTTVKISNEELSIKRFGTLNSNMIFNKSKIYTSMYHTAQGIFEIKIDTKQLNIIKNESSIDISISYDINVVGLFEGHNNIKIEVRYK